MTPAPPYERIGEMDQAMGQEHLMEMNEAVTASQFAGLGDCAVSLAHLLRVTDEVPFVIGRCPRAAYPRGRCRRR
jgi:hypothetical protein